jgi:hypothetical protein
MTPPQGTNLARATDQTSVKLTIDESDTRKSNNRFARFAAAINGNRGESFND